MKLNGSTKLFLKRCTSFVLTICFLTTSIAWSAPLAPQLSPVATDLKKISIPETLGRVDELYLPESVDSDSRLVIFIQDAHANLDAQKNISEIAAHLGKRLKIDAILKEGGSGEADLSELRSFPDQPVKNSVTDFWMKEAVLSGIERQAIIGNKSYRFFGIEEQKLYEQGSAYFVEAHNDSKSLLPTLNFLHTKNKENQKNVFNPELLRFEELVEKFESKHELVPLVELVANEARNLHINRWKYLEIEKFIDLILAEMNGERSERIFEIQKTLDSKKLFSEIELLKAEVKGALFQNKKERILDREAQFLNVLKSMVSLEATTQDFGFFEENKKSIEKYLNKRKLDSKAIEPAEKFYESARERDLVLFSNINEILKTQNVKRAFLVAGGFHTQNITEQFRKHKISYAVITPQVSDENNFESYFARIAGKRAALEYFKSKFAQSPSVSTHAAPAAVLNPAEVYAIVESIGWELQKRIDQERPNLDSMRAPPTSVAVNVLIGFLLAGSSLFTARFLERTQSFVKWLEIIFSSKRGQDFSNKDHVQLQIRHVNFNTFQPLFNPSQSISNISKSFSEGAKLFMDVLKDYIELAFAGKIWVILIVSHENPFFAGGVILAREISQVKGIVARRAELRVGKQSSEELWQFISRLSDHKTDVTYENPFDLDLFQNASQYAEMEFGLKPGFVALEIGPGYDSNAARGLIAAGASRVVGLNHDDAKPEEEVEGLQIIKGDAAELPSFLNTQNIDAVIFNGSLIFVSYSAYPPYSSSALTEEGAPTALMRDQYKENPAAGIEKAKKALREAYRVLPNNGLLMIRLGSYQNSKDYDGFLAQKKEADQLIEWFPEIGFEKIRIATRTDLVVTPAKNIEKVETPVFLMATKAARAEARTTGGQNPKENLIELRRRTLLNKLQSIENELIRKKQTSTLEEKALVKFSLEWLPEEGRVQVKDVRSYLLTILYLSRRWNDTAGSLIWQEARAAQKLGKRVRKEPFPIPKRPWMSVGVVPIKLSFRAEKIKEIAWAFFEYEEALKSLDKDWAKKIKAGLIKNLVGAQAFWDEVLPVIDPIRARSRYDAEMYRIMGATKLIIEFKDGKKIENTFNEPKSFYWLFGEAEKNPNWYNWPVLKATFIPRPPDEDDEEKNFSQLYLKLGDEPLPDISRRAEVRAEVGSGILKLFTPERMKKSQQLVREILLRIKREGKLGILAQFPFHPVAVVGSWAATMISQGRSLEWVHQHILEDIEDLESTIQRKNNILPFYSRLRGDIKEANSRIQNYFNRPKKIFLNPEQVILVKGLYSKHFPVLAGAIAYPLFNRIVLKELTVRDKPKRHRVSVLIHEALHLSAVGLIPSTWMNEGMTELITRRMLPVLQNEHRVTYDEEVHEVEALIERFGLKPILQAYLVGDYEFVQRILDLETFFKYFLQPHNFSFGNRQIIYLQYLFTLYPDWDLFQRIDAALALESAHPPLWSNARLSSKKYLTYSGHAAPPLEPYLLKLKERYRGSKRKRLTKEEWESVNREISRFRSEQQKFIRLILSGVRKPSKEPARAEVRMERQEKSPVAVYIGPTSVELLRRLYSREIEVFDGFFELDSLVKLTERGPREIILAYAINQARDTFHLFEKDRTRVIDRLSKIPGNEIIHFTYSRTLFNRASSEPDVSIEVENQLDQYFPRQGLNRAEVRTNQRLVEARFGINDYLKAYSVVTLHEKRGSKELKKKMAAQRVLLDSIKRDLKDDDAPEENVKSALSKLNQFFQDQGFNSRIFVIGDETIREDNLKSYRQALNVRRLIASIHRSLLIDDTEQLIRSHDKYLPTVDPDLFERAFENLMRNLRLENFAGAHQAVGDLQRFIVEGSRYAPYLIKDLNSRVGTLEATSSSRAEVRTKDLSKRFEYYFSIYQTEESIEKKIEALREINIVLTLLKNKAERERILKILLDEYNRIQQPKVKEKILSVIGKSASSIHVIRQEFLNIISQPNLHVNLILAGLEAITFSFQWKDFNDDLLKILIQFTFQPNKKIQWMPLFILHGINNQKNKQKILIRLKELGGDPFIRQLQKIVNEISGDQDTLKASVFAKQLLEILGYSIELPKAASASDVSQERSPPERDLNVAISEFTKEELWQIYHEIKDQHLSSADLLEQYLRTSQVVFIVGPMLNQLDGFNKDIEVLTQKKVFTHLALPISLVFEDELKKLRKGGRVSHRFRTYLSEDYGLSEPSKVEGLHRMLMQLPQDIVLILYGSDPAEYGGEVYDAQKWTRLSRPLDQVLTNPANRVLVYESTEDGMPVSGQLGHKLAQHLLKNPKKPSFTFVLEEGEHVWEIVSKFGSHHNLDKIFDIGYLPNFSIKLEGTLLGRRRYSRYYDLALSSLFDGFIYRSEKEDDGGFREKIPQPVPSKGKKARKVLARAEVRADQLQPFLEELKTKLKGIIGKDYEKKAARYGITNSHLAALLESEDFKREIPKIFKRFNIPLQPIINLIEAIRKKMKEDPRSPFFDSMHWFSTQLYPALNRMWQTAQTREIRSQEVASIVTPVMRQIVPAFQLADFSASNDVIDREKLDDLLFNFIRPALIESIKLYVSLPTPRLVPQMEWEGNIPLVAGPIVDKREITTPEDNKAIVYSVLDESGVFPTTTTIEDQFIVKPVTHHRNGYRMADFNDQSVRNLEGILSISRQVKAGQSAAPAHIRNRPIAWVLFSFLGTFQNVDDFLDPLYWVVGGFEEMGHYDDARFGYAWNRKHGNLSRGISDIIPTLLRDDVPNSFLDEFRQAGTREEKLLVAHALFEFSARLKAVGSSPYSSYTLLTAFKEAEIQEYSLAKRYLIKVLSKEFGVPEEGFEAFIHTKILEGDPTLFNPILAEKARQAYPEYFWSKEERIERLKRAETRTKPEKENYLTVEELKRQLENQDWKKFEENFSSFNESKILHLLVAISQIAEQKAIKPNTARRAYEILDSAGIHSAFPNNKQVARAFLAAYLALIRLSLRSSKRREKGEVDFLKALAAVDEIKEGKSSTEVFLEADSYIVRDEAVDSVILRRIDNKSRDEFKKAAIDEGLMAVLHRFIWSHSDFREASHWAGKLGLLYFISDALGYPLNQKHIRFYRRALSSADPTQRKIATSFFSHFSKPGITDSPEILDRLMEIVKDEGEDTEIREKAFDALRQNAFSIDPSFFDSYFKNRKKQPFQILLPWRKAGDLILKHLKVSSQGVDQITKIRRSRSFLDLSQILDFAQKRDVSLQMAAFLIWLVEQTSNKKLSLQQAQKMILRIARELPRRAEVRQVYRTDETLQQALTNSLQSISSRITHSGLIRVRVVYQEDKKVKHVWDVWYENGRLQNRKSEGTFAKSALEFIQGRKNKLAVVKQSVYELSKSSNKNHTIISVWINNKMREQGRNGSHRAEVRSHKRESASPLFYQLAYQLGNLNFNGQVNKRVLAKKLEDSLRELFGERVLSERRTWKYVKPQDLEIEESSHSFELKILPLKEGQYSVFISEPLEPNHVKRENFVMDGSNPPEETAQFKFLLNIPVDSIPTSQAVQFVAPQWYLDEEGENIVVRSELGFNPANRDAKRYEIFAWVLNQRGRDGERWKLEATELVKNEKGVFAEWKIPLPHGKPQPLRYTMVALKDVKKESELPKGQSYSSYLANLSELIRDAKTFSLVSSKLREQHAPIWLNHEHRDQVIYPYEIDVALAELGKKTELIDDLSLVIKGRIRGQLASRRLALRLKDLSTRPLDREKALRELAELPPDEVIQKLSNEQGQPVGIPLVEVLIRVLFPGRFVDTYASGYEKLERLVQNHPDLQKLFEDGELQYHETGQPGMFLFSRQFQGSRVFIPFHFGPNPNFQKVWFAVSPEESFLVEEKRKGKPQEFVRDGLVEEDRQVEVIQDSFVQVYDEELEKFYPRLHHIGDTWSIGVPPNGYQILRRQPVAVAKAGIGNDVSKVSVLLVDLFYELYRSLEIDFFITRPGSQENEQAPRITDSNDDNQRDALIRFFSERSGSVRISAASMKANKATLERAIKLLDQILFFTKYPEGLEDYSSFERAHIIEQAKLLPDFNRTEKWGQGEFSIEKPSFTLEELLSKVQAVRDLNLPFIIYVTTSQKAPHDHFVLGSDLLAQAKKLGINRLDIQIDSKSEVAFGIEGAASKGRIQEFVSLLVKSLTPEMLEDDFTEMSEADFKKDLENLRRQWDQEDFQETNELDIRRAETRATNKIDTDTSSVVNQKKRMIVSLKSLEENGELRSELRKVLETNRHNKMLEVVVYAPEYESELQAEGLIIEWFGPTAFIELPLQLRSRKGLKLFDAKLKRENGLNRLVEDMLDEVGAKGFTTRVVIIDEEAVLPKVTRRAPKLFARPEALKAALLLFELDGSIDWFRIAGVTGVLNPTQALINSLQQSIMAQLKRAIAA